MFDFIAFLETHKLVDTVIVLLVIGLGVLVWREVSRWFNDRHHRDIISEEASNAVKRVEVALQEHMKMAANLCDGKNCANFEAIAKEFCQLRDVILRFEHDAKAYTEEFDGLAAGVTWDGDDDTAAKAKREEIKKRYPYPGKYRYKVEDVE